MVLLGSTIIFLPCSAACVIHLRRSKVKSVPLMKGAGNVMFVFGRGGWGCYTLFWLTIHFFRELLGTDHPILNAAAKVCYISILSCCHIPIMLQNCCCTRVINWNEWCNQPQYLFDIGDGGKKVRPTMVLLMSGALNETSLKRGGVRVSQKVTAHPLTWIFTILLSCYLLLLHSWPCPYTHQNVARQRRLAEITEV